MTGSDSETNQSNAQPSIADELAEMVDRFVVGGAQANDVLDIIAIEVGRLRDLYDRDPDPAEDPRDRDGAAVDEPSNDWPAADV